LKSIDETNESLKLIEMEKIIPGGKELAQLVVGVRNLAARSNLKVAEMKFEPGKVATTSATASATKREKAEAAKENKSLKEEQKDKLIFSLALKGKLNRINKFLTRIEKAKRLLGVRKIEITQEEKVYKLDFEIFSPFTDREEEADIVSAPLPVLTALHNRTYEFVNKFDNLTNITIPLVPKGVKNPFK
jgi:Tfp pilus assembly protein PilO